MPRSQSGQCTCFLPHFFGQESSVFGKSETFGTPGNQQKIQCNPWEDQTIPLSIVWAESVIMTPDWCEDLPSTGLSLLSVKALKLDHRCCCVTFFFPLSLSSSFSLSLSCLKNCLLHFTILRWPLFLAMQLAFDQPVPAALACLASSSVPWGGLSKIRTPTIPQQYLADKRQESMMFSIASC